MIYYHHVVSVPDRRMVVLPTTEMLSIYPNPFNGVSTFAFSLWQPGAVRIDIFNTLGKRQVELVSGNYATGIHNVSWDGSGLPSGEYIVKMTAGEQVNSRKVMMIK